MIGTLQQRYRILAKLGEGGMGEVYLAEHIGLGRKEALKILQPELAAEAQFVQRFRREARATNRLSHPNIVAVHDFGQLPDGRFYLSMEYAEGERLDSLLRRVGPLPTTRALHLLEQLADAIGHAHSRGVIHRDLKPANLIVGEHRGHADALKVLDFGIAKIIAPEYRESIGLTKQGDIFGTPAYIAPEQWQGTSADPRSDLYALGCLAFEMLVGAPPFVGRTMELMHLHLTKPPDAPSRRTNAAVPAELDEMVLRCLEKDPSRRIATARDVITALQRVPGYKMATKTPTGKRSYTGLTPLTDFVEPPDTSVDAKPKWASDVGAAPTEHVSVEDVVRAHRSAVVELVEALLDYGTRDLALVLGLGRVRELEDARARDLGEWAALEAQATEIEQSVRERGGALRFAIGELMFDRAQADGHPDLLADLDYQITELEKRLAALNEGTEAELKRVADREVTLSESDDSGLAGAYEAIELAGLAASASFSAHEVIGPLVQRVRVLRESINALPGRSR